LLYRAEREIRSKATAMPPIFSNLSGRHLGFCALLILALLGVSPARASAASPAAEALFREGRKLMAKNQIDKACAKFAESQRVEASTGTLLNLATCHTKQGKTATAWVEFAEALAAAKKENDALRVDYAEAQMAALEPKLSKIMVSAAAPASGMSVTIDGSAVVLDSPLPFDPGSHTVKASAPGRTPFTIEVELAATAETKTVRIPELALEPRAVPLTAKAAPQGSEPTHGTSRSSTDELGSQPQPWRRPLAYSLGGLGAAALGVGTYLALAARSELAEAESDPALCPGKVCVPAGREQVNAAETKANIATGAFAGGIAAVGVATYLLLTPRSATARAPKRLSRHWLPLVSAQGVGLTVQGEFQ
jgi:hypothetical protein